MNLKYWPLARAAAANLSFIGLLPFVLAQGDVPPPPTPLSPHDMMHNLQYGRESAGDILERHNQHQDDRKKYEFQVGIGTRVDQDHRPRMNQNERPQKLSRQCLVDKKIQFAIKTKADAKLCNKKSGVIISL